MGNPSDCLNNCLSIPGLPRRVNAMKHKLIVIILLLGALAARGQYFEVSQPKEVTLPDGCKGYHALFMPDGEHLVVTGEAFDGLATVGLNSDGTDYRKLSDEPGVGYKVGISRDGKILSRSNAPQKRTYVTEVDLKMVVCVNGVCRIVDPIADAYGRDVNYCWTSLSPDGKRLLFVAHNNAYTSELDGSDLVDLGPLHAPVWRDNDWVVGMIDSDDGHEITASDIYIVAARDANKSQRLTPADSDIKMYPAVSADGARVAYNTIDGDIYILDIKPPDQ